MKQILHYSLLAAAAVFFISCSKEAASTNEEGIIPNDPQDETPVTPTEYDPSEYLLSFGAAFEEDKTKVVINVESGALSFEEGDEVLVYVPATDAQSVYVYDHTQSLFVPKEPAAPVAVGNNVAYVYYPSAEFTISSETVTFTMPEAIAAGSAEDLGDKVPMAGIIPAGAKEDGHPLVTFKNLGSILRARFNSSATDGGETITAVELSVTGANITGAGTVGWSGVTDTAVPSVSALGGGTSITISVVDGHLTKEAYKDFYFFLPASGELTAMTIKAVYGKTGGYEPYQTVSRTSSMTLERNKIYKVQKSLSGFFSGGDGSETYPYQIATADDFKAIATLANAVSEADGNGYNAATSRTFFGSSDVHYVQTADIDFGNATLTSIGVYDATAANAIPFMGCYDGGGETTLSKFKVTGTQAASTGLFEYVDGATLKNIAIGQCQVTGENVTGILTGRCIGETIIDGCSLTGPANVTGRNSVGFIAHVLGSTLVKNCTVSNITVITAASGADANNQGGVVGFAGGASKIESCSTSGDIQFTGTASGVARGGIVGKFDSTGEVKNCTNDADITSVLVNYAGGIAGQLTKGTITECVNTGDVTGLGYVGGITGAMLPASSTCVYVNKCRVDATVKGTGDENTEACVGGIVGSMQNGVLNTCFAKGSVENTWYDTGGIAGQIYANGADAAYNRPYVFDCIAANDIKCTRPSGSSNVGGVVGRINRNSNYTDQYTAVDNCIGLNQTITATLQYAGAFVGNVNASATNNNRVRVRNCISLVDDSHLQVNTSANYTGGFAGAYLGALIHCYYLVSDNSQTAVTGTTAASNLTKSNLATLTSAAFCTAHSSRAAGYNLTVNGVQYKSSGWTKPQDVDYPVPTTLYNLGSEYYK